MTKRELRQAAESALKTWDPDKKFRKWSRKQFRNKQARFENDMISITGLGFGDIDGLTEAVLDRMSGKVGANHSHRPNLWDDNA